MKKISLSLLLALLSMFGISGIIFADTSYIDKISSALSVSPASYDASAGKSFDVSVQLDPNVNKVCAISGNLSFTTESIGNPSLNKITASKGVTSQITPSQINPNFYLTIPGCTTAKQDVLKLSISGYKGGKASLTFNGVAMYGPNGKIVPSQAKGGKYNIIAAAEKKQNKFLAALSLQLNKINFSQVLNIFIIVLALMAIYFSVIFFIKRIRK